MKKICVLIFMIVIFIALFSSQSESGELSISLQPVVSPSIKNDVSPELRSIAHFPYEMKEKIREIPIMPLHERFQMLLEGEGGAVDPIVQDWHGTANMPALIQNFEG